MLETDIAKLRNHLIFPILFYNFFFYSAMYRQAVKISDYVKTVVISNKSLAMTLNDLKGT